MIQKFDDTGCVWNCEAKSQVLGLSWDLAAVFHVLRSLKCQWYQWDRTPEKSPISCGLGQCAQLTLVLSKGFGLNDLQKCLPTPAVLCFCGSNFNICSQSCLTSLHLVISHSTGINTWFPELVLYRAVVDPHHLPGEVWGVWQSLSSQLQKICLKNRVFCSYSGFTPGLGGNPQKGRHWLKPLLVKVPVCTSVWKVERWSLAVLFSSEETTGTLCVCVCVCITTLQLQLQ